MAAPATAMSRAGQIGPLERLQKASIVFWDFDGVIKDSVEVKSAGYEQLFLPYGEAVASRVRQHHEAHGGMSRYDKIPTYLAWAGESVTADQTREFCERFSALVLQAVIDSAWVPGVPEYLLEHYENQYFVLVTATPQAEIQQILQATGISGYFREVHGAPESKAAAVRDVLQHFSCHAENALMVGDSESDLHAAEVNKVSFLLRRTPLNHVLQNRYSGPMFDNLKS